MCLAVMSGLDTDCNGATVGSITGAARGLKNFGGRLAEPLNDTIRSQVIGFQNISMRELAQRSLETCKAVRAYREKRTARA